MVTQDTSQWMAKKQGKVKQFLGGSIAELNLDTPPGAEKVTLYDQRGTLVTAEDSSRRLFDWTPPSKIEDSVGSAVETVPKLSGKKRKRGKRGRR